MKLFKIVTAAVCAASLSACSLASLLPPGPPPPPDPAVMAAIVQACTIDGIFKEVGGRLVLSSVPYVGTADFIIAAGVDTVCANPAQFASDASTAVWVAQNIAAAILAGSQPVPAAGMMRRY